MLPIVSRRELLLATCGIAVSGAGQAAARPASVKIANAGGSLNQTMEELMRQQGFMETFGLTPEFLTVADGTRILGGIVSGSVDVSMASGFGQVFPAIERGAGIKILAGGALLPALALFSAKPGVRALKDLEGKVIGTGSVGALVYQLTVTLLQKYQVDVAKIRFVNIGSSADIYRAVAAGTVDAGAVDVALVDNAAEHRMHLLEHGNMSVELKEFTYQGAWASDREIAANRDVLVRTMAAYATLYRFVQNPQARDAFMRARRAVFPTAAESDHLGLWSYIQNYKPFAVDLALTPERLRYMQALNVGFKVQKQILPFERVADMSLAADALKLLNSVSGKGGK